MITLKVIAKEAGVSVTTVSDVLNLKSKERRVSRECSTKVLDIARKLNYRPHIHGRALALKKTFQVGIITPSMHTSFWGDILAGLLEVLENKNYHLIISYTEWDKEKTENRIKEMMYRNVDGLVVLGQQIPKSIKITVPVINSHGPYEHSSIPWVSINQEKGCQLAADHLFECGHKKVGLLGNMLRRTECVEKALNLKGIKTQQLNFEDFLALEQIDFTALFCHSDDYAIRAMGHLHKTKKTVPEDVAVIGFDDIPMAQWIYPSLTTIRQPKKEFGHALANQLLNGMQGLKMKSILLDPELVVRESTGGGG